jgi:hypothetical protein
MQAHEAERFHAVFAYMAAMPKGDPLALQKAVAHFDKALAMKRRSDDKRSPNLQPERWVGTEWAQVCTIAQGLRPEEQLKALEIYGGYRPAVSAEKNPNWRVCWELSDAVKSTRFVLWWNGKRFSPALFCSDLKTAVHVQALLRIAGGQAFRVCPYCDKAFLQDRSNQDYCCLAHREAHRVARWRAKQKAKKRSKGDKHGTRKTR